MPPIPHLPKLFPSFTTYVHPTSTRSFCRPSFPQPSGIALPQSSYCQLCLSRGPHPKALSLCLQEGPGMQDSGPGFSLRLLKVLQAKDKTLWKNSLSQKAAHVHQSQCTVYFKTICHSSGLVINFPSCKYIPLGVRTASCYLRKL